MKKVRAYFAALVCLVVVFSFMLPIAVYAAEVPDTPAVQTAVASPTSITITWNKIKDAAGYRVYRKTDAGWKYLKTVTGTSYTDTGLTAGATYTHTAKAFWKVDGKEIYGGHTKGTSCKLIPETPEVKTSVASSSSIKVTWNKVTGAAGYRVYRKTDAGWKYLKTVTGTSYTDTGLTAGATYTHTAKAFWKVNGKEVYGEHTKGTSCKLSLATPTVTVKETAPKCVTVSWNKIPGAEGYRVYRKTDAGWKYLKTVTGTSYTESGLTAGQSYTYTAKALWTVNGKEAYGGHTKGTTCTLTQTIGTAVCTAESFMNLRSGPGTSYAKTGTLKAGAKVDVYEKSGAWYKIETGGAYHWANGTYLKVTLHSDGNTSTGDSSKYSEYPIAKNSKLKGKVVVLDPGHGKGYGGYYDGYYEYVYTLKHAELVKQNLENCGATVIMTRTDNTHVNNYARVSLANQYALKLVREDRQERYNKLMEQTGQEESLTALTEKKTAADEAVQQAAQKLAEAQATLDTLNGELIEKQNAAKTLEEQIAAAEAAGDAETLEQLTEQIVAANTTVTECETEIAAKQEEIKGKNDALKKTQENAENAAQELQNAKDAAAATRQSAEKEAQELADEIKEIDRLIGIMQSVIDDPELADTYYLSPYDQVVGRAIHEDLKKIFEYQKEIDNMIYVSIHTNAPGSSDTSVNGTVTYYMNNSQRTSYYTGYPEAKSKKLATAFYNEVTEAGGYKKRGVSVNDFFMVREVAIPAALIEIGFHTNESDREKLMDSAIQKRVANGITYAILDYFN